MQPISEIAKAVRNKRKEYNSEIYFHTDASQAPLYFSLNTLKLGVDMMTLGGHKMYGPKGIGCLYIKKDTNINLPRTGTENVPLIVGFAKALELAEAEKQEESDRLKILRDYFISELKNKIPRAGINGSREARAPNNVNVYISNMNAEFMAIILDNNDIACATRSACREGEAGPRPASLGLEEEGSYVIEVLGYSKERSKSSLRFSLGKDTTKADIDYVVKILGESIKKYSA
ncbi:MAG: cysteine desulfurase family protein [Candidatus Paceibacteria bacterium]